MRYWDRDFISEELGKTNIKEIQRVWVCGPPKMNEVFDRAFTDLIEEGLDLEPH